MNPRFMEQLKNELNMIQLTSKPIVENVEAWQQHGTPDEVVDMMLDMYYENGFKNNERILILFNVEFIKQIYFKYKDELIFGNIYFIADSKEKFDIVSKLYPTVHCLFCIEHDIEKLIEKIGEFNVKKFDVIFSNPPYGTANSNALDLRILKNCFNIAKNIVFVHPAGFLIDRFTAKDIKIELGSSNFLKETLIFWGNELFGIGLFVPLAITIWDTTKKNDIVIVNDKAYSNFSFTCNISKIKGVHFSKIIKLKLEDDFENFENKINSFEKNIWDSRVKPDYSNITNFSVVLPRIQGPCALLANIPKKDVIVDFSFRPKRNRDDERRIWSFENEYNRQNFINYCKTKIIRFCLSLTKIDQGISPISLKRIPWLDFSQEWNDAKLCKEFEISEKLWNYIDNFIPDYYDDYKSGFEK